MAAHEDARQSDVSEEVMPEGRNSASSEWEPSALQNKKAVQKRKHEEQDDCEPSKKILGKLGGQRSQQER